MRDLELGEWSNTNEVVVDKKPLRLGDKIVFMDDSPFEGCHATIEKLAKDRAVFRLIANGFDVEADIYHVAAA